VKLLVDMNLSPGWCEVLRAAGHEASHGSSVGRASAPDRELLGWPRAHGHVVLTHDLDFAALLAGSGDTEPSVVQVRTSDPTPASMGTLVVRVLARFEAELGAGAIVTIDRERGRARVLPLR
jgi:predicted nuclease of predicted toxin-antitoxin system